MILLKYFNYVRFWLLVNVIPCIGFFQLTSFVHPDTIHMSRQEAGLIS